MSNININVNVKPYSVDSVNVVIICPYCSKYHIHGSCSGKKWSGERVAHCYNGDYNVLPLYDEIYCVTQTCVKKLCNIGINESIYSAFQELRCAKKQFKLNCKMFSSSSSSSSSLSLTPITKD